MKPEQRKDLINQFNSMKIKCPSGAFTTPNHDYVALQDQMPQTSLCSLPNKQVNCMSISVADCNIYLY